MNRLDSNNKYKLLVNARTQILAILIVTVLTCGGVLAFVWPKWSIVSNSNSIKTQSDEPKQKLTTIDSSKTNQPDVDKPKETEDIPVSAEQTITEPEYINANEADAYVRGVFKSKLIECTVDVSRQQTYAGYYWIHYDAMKAGQPYVAGSDGTPFYEKYYKYIIDNNVDRVKTRYFELLNNGDNGVINYVIHNPQYNRCKSAMSILKDSLPATHTVCDDPSTIPEDPNTTEQTCRQVLD